MLIQLFGERISLSTTCWQCFNLTKKNTDDYTTFASVVNKECEKFKFSELTPDMFKCLIFVQEQTAQKDAEIRSRLLSKVEQDSKLTLQNIAEGYQRIIDLRHDAGKIEERDILHIHSAEKKGTRYKNEFSFRINPCYECNQIHLNKNCPRKKEFG